MAGMVTTRRKKAASAQRRVQRDPTWVKWLLIAFAVAFMGVFVIVPVLNVSWQAFSKGAAGYVGTFFFAPPSAREEETLSDGDLSVKEDRAQMAEYNRSAVVTTLFVAAMVVPLNALFGVAAAWLLVRFSADIRVRWPRWC